MAIELTKKQIEYVRDATHRWNFAVGAVRSGKSHLAVQYIIPHCIRERKGKRGINLILGASKENIERNVLTPMRDIWGASMVSDINSRNIATVFGEKVYCIGAENIRQVSKLRGSEIKFCYCDEVVDIHKEVFEMLKSRLSLPYSVCHAAANPSYPTHFIKEFIDSADRGVDIYTQKYTIYDNPFLPRSYVKALEAEYQGTVYFARYILGEWARAEGLIYPMYQQALAKPDPSKPVADRVLSVDYGTQNAFAALLWYKVDGVWYAVDGYYYSGRQTGLQKTDDEYLQDLEKFLETDIDSAGRLRVIIDPSAASFIALLKQTGWAKVLKADNDVLDGIRQTATAMHRGLIKVNPDIKAWIYEVEGYVWDERQEDRPIKENDHFMDATRYFVRTMHITDKKRKYKPLWN